MSGDGRRKVVGEGVFVWKSPVELTIVPGGVIGRRWLPLVLTTYRMADLGAALPSLSAIATSTHYRLTRKRFTSTSSAEARRVPPRCNFSFRIDVPSPQCAPGMDPKLLKTIGSG
jgi:hypothetical protein